MIRQNQTGAEWRLHLAPPHILLVRHDEAGSAEVGRVALADRYFDGRLAVLAALAAGEALPLVAVLPPDALVEAALPWPARPGWRRRLAARLGVPAESIDMVSGRGRGTARAVAVAPRGLIEETVGFLSQSGFEPSFVAAEGSGTRYPLPRRRSAATAAGRLMAVASKFRDRPGPVAAGLLTVALGALTLMAPSDLPHMPNMTPPPQASAPVTAPAAADPAPRELPRQTEQAAAAKPAQLISMASRSLDPETAAALARGDGEADELTTASRPMPAPRPITEPLAPARPAGLRPLERPAAAEAAAPVEVAPQAAARPGRPLPRPLSTAEGALPAAITAAVAEASSPVTLAKQSPSELAAGSLVRALASAARPAPRRAWTAATKPTETPRAATRPVPVRAAAPVVQAERSPEPVAVARVSPPAQAAARQPSVGRGDLALVGVFGSASARHALVRMPDGAVRRVRAGDQFGGLQIAGVAADSIRVRANGRDAVLRMPD